MPIGSGTEFSGKMRGAARSITSLFIICVVSLATFLLYRTLSSYHYHEIVASVTSIPLSRLLSATAFAASSYVCLTLFDVLALRYIRHALPYRKVALASFCSLSLGHNIGFAALSSGTIRYRFYSRLGLRTEEIAKIIVFCGVTVGLGLSTLTGITLALRPDIAQDVLRVNRGLIYGACTLSLAIPVAYAFFASLLRSPVRVWNWSFGMPVPALAVAQIAVGTLNFALVAACLHQALSAVSEIPYVAVVSVYVIANVATLITHVPGGLGVIESVVLFLLPKAQLVGAVLVFRFVYFLLPLVMGGALFVIAELQLRMLRDSGGAHSSHSARAAKAPATPREPG
jgi:glycosyltransferase 2 family protein